MTTAPLAQPAFVSTSLATRRWGCGERMTHLSHASAGANSTFRPGRLFVKPLPSLLSVSMKMKTIWTAKPPPMPHGSSSLRVDATEKSALSPETFILNSVRSNEPGL